MSLYFVQSIIEYLLIELIIINKITRFIQKRQVAIKMNIICMIFYSYIKVKHHIFSENNNRAKKKIFIKLVLGRWYPCINDKKLLIVYLFAIYKSSKPCNFKFLKYMKSRQHNLNREFITKMYFYIRDFGCFQLRATLVLCL